MREDVFTNTEADAGEYERQRGRDDPWYDDRPDPGEPAPVFQPRVVYEAEVLAIRLGRFGLFGIGVVPIRDEDGVVKVVGVHDTSHEAWAQIGDEYEVKVVDRTVWVKHRRSPDTGPPF